MKYLLSLILLASLTTSASAQISITSEEYIAAFANTSSQQNFQTSDTTGLRALETATGASQSYDFTAYTWTPATSATAGELIPASAAPLSSDPELSAATHAIRSPNNNVMDYLFVKVNTDGLWLVGMVQDSAGITKKVGTYNPPVQQMKFPLTYGTHWTSTSQVNSPDLPPGATFSITYDNTVDGSGTIMLPGNKSASVLKITSLQTTTIAAPPFFTSTSHDYQYNFVTKAGLNATISADSALRPTGATYSITTQSDVKPATRNADALTIYMDPASGSATKLYYTMEQDGPANVALIDASGRIISTLHNGMTHAGANELTLDRATVGSGLYFVRLTTSSGTHVAKVIIAH